MTTAQALPKPEFKRQLSSGFKLILTGRVFLAWDTALIFTWWMVVTALDFYTTWTLIQGGLGEEANPVAAALFSVFTPLGTMVVASFICLALAAFMVGDHAPENTYLLLLAPMGVLLIKTFAAFHNLLLLVM